MLQQAKVLSKKNSLVICDRFPQKDIMGYYDGPKLQSAKSNRFSRLEMKQFEQLSGTEADVVFRLNVSAEIATRRKPGHDCKLIEQKCNSLTSLSFGNATIIDVDAGKPYEQVLLDIKRKIWQIL